MNLISGYICSSKKRYSPMEEKWYSALSKKEVAGGGGGGGGGEREKWGGEKKTVKVCNKKQVALSGRLLSFLCLLLMTQTPWFIFTQAVVISCLPSITHYILRQVKVQQSSMLRSYAVLSVNTLLVGVI